MPITKSAQKAAVRSQKLRIQNDVFKHAMKSAVKNVIKLHQKGQPIPQDVLQQTYKAIDKALKAGVVKKNTAARRKSRVAKLVNTQK